MFNSTYYSSIYRDSQGIKTHGMKMEYQSFQGTYAAYSNTYVYNLFMFVDIPQYPFYFSAIMIQMQDGDQYHSKLHPDFMFRTVIFKKYHMNAKKCYSNYYVDKQGKCIYLCNNYLQRILGDKCQDLEDEIPYSKYLIKEYFDKTNNPEYYSQYKLVSKTGLNFLKGEDIYYSYWQQNRIFGGPYVWSQAEFERIHKIENAHHSISISFQIVYGPNFPSNSQFIYTIEANQPVSCQKSSATDTYSDGSKLQTINKKITHNSDTLTIKWECKGEDNEPILAYCGIYRYYIIVHYCQPYCLQCDQSTCIQWDNYDSSLIKFSESECQEQQYYDSFLLKCFNCPSQCQTCKSQIDCTACQPTYTLTKLGCVCQKNQYDAGFQCVNCPEQCEQCVSSSFCLSCSIQKYRKLLNGQCECIDGYYSISTDLICLRCHLYCKTCLGPTSDHCQECQNINNIEKVGSTCKCLTGTAYQDQLKICAPCHQTCLTCFRITIDGCLNCDSNLHRVLRGLKCECQPGYYELDNICQNCPDTENSSLSQCYKLCIGNQLIWHTNNCSNCDIGYELISNHCQPKCGDSNLIQSFEECEDNNNTLDDLCYNCKFQCPIHCLVCDSSTTIPCPDVCGDGIITGSEECEDNNDIQYDGCFNCKYQCDPYCTKCIMGNCLECLTRGWVVDTSSNIWKCKEQCGDGVVVGNEQCDDQNLSETDGCKDCKYFCRKGCSSCDYSKGICLSCEQTGYAPSSYYCRNICGDGLVVNGLYGYFQEYCDDGNNDSSSQCNSDCTGCAKGYQRGQNLKCEPVCGDRIKSIEEICESGNILPYKGCQNCLARCQVSCKICDTSGNGCIQCKLGYMKLNNVCHPICGDGIIVDDEECDDGNLIYGDGCHLCRFSCVQSCISCINGICYLQQDEENYILEKCLSNISLNINRNIQQNICILFNDLDYQNKSYLKNLFYCPPNCKLCQFQICYLCQEGYELTPIKQDCIQSSIFQDQLQYCQVSAPFFCLKCQEYAYFDIYENRCKLPSYYLNLKKECSLGYYLNDFSECISQCGDGILANDEECETQDENCIYCEYQKPFRCQNFLKDICLQCEDGYYFNIIKKSCEINLEYEPIANNENDFYFIICQLKLSKDCLTCEQGICLQCKQDYFFLNGLCMASQTTQLVEIDNPNNNLKNYKFQTFLFGQFIQCDVYQYNEYNDKNTIFLFKKDLDQNKNECNSLCELCKNQSCIQCKYGYYGKNCQLRQVNFQIAKLKQYYSTIDIYQEDQSCESDCLVCFLGQCIFCREGSYLFNHECIQQNLIEYYRIKQVRCGDKIVSIGEFCDDGNNVQYDGCFECQYSCDLYCLKCEFGLCLQCQDGFILIEESYTCEPQCGDGKVIPFTQEQCDNNNLDPSDECDQCKFVCLPHCLACFNLFTCAKCEKGFIFRQEKCIPICGDGILIPEFEECDDNNQIKYDGCYECKYQCSQDCLDCQKGICQKQCPKNMIAFENECMSECGQMLVNYEIECDDDNNIEYDGCFNCKFQCAFGCDESFCQKGICLKFRPEFTQQSQHFQIPDDLDESLKNILNNQQSSWICNQSECTYSESPQIIINNLGFKNQKQLIKITFDQEVKCYFSQDQEIFRIYFENIEQTFYTSLCYASKNQELSNITKQVEYLVEIEFSQQIFVQPILIVQPELLILNSNNQSVNITNYKITLHIPLILQDKELVKSQQMQQASQGVVITSISLAVLSLFSGGPSFIEELLNIIQYQSFLKFINLEYPQNLLIFFQASEMLSISNHLQFFNFGNFINNIYPKQLNFQLNGKFLYYELEAILITNITPQIFQAFVIVLIIYSGYFFDIIFQKLLQNQYFITTFENRNSLSKKYILIFFRKTRQAIKFLKISKYSFSFKQVKQILLLNSWDLLFKSILYLYCNQEVNIRSIIESSMSLAIITILYISLSALFSLRQKINISKQKRKIRLNIFNL
ncbi:unnamed protein product [Paramecium sonneborni]|uniref:4Fe-4S ferredoxin-type domain-containing protein n=1 Tax=Paramecium sonneborni TaxID=65129 RepID=A0A8S1LP67_9CILI|nr:unnamed protein product [Paramecium sonneborni]